MHSKGASQMRRNGSEDSIGQSVDLLNKDDNEVVVSDSERIDILEKRIKTMKRTFIFLVAILCIPIITSYFYHAPDKHYHGYADAYHSHSDYATRRHDHN